MEAHKLGAYSQGVRLVSISKFSHLRQNFRIFEKYRKNVKNAIPSFVKRQQSSEIYELMSVVCLNL